MFGVSCDNRHLPGTGDGSDEGVVQRSPIRNSEGGKHPCSRQVEWEYPIGECGQNSFLEPLTKHSTLVWILTFLADHPTFDLCDGYG